MARYQVKHTFPSPYVTHVGQVFTDPEWPNLQVLVDQGYLTLMDEEKASKPEPEIMEETEPTPEVTEPAAEPEIEEPKPPAEEPIEKPVPEAPSEKPAKKKAKASKK